MSGVSKMRARMIVRMQIQRAKMRLRRIEMMMMGNPPKNGQPSPTPSPSPKPSPSPMNMNMNMNMGMNMNGGSTPSITDDINDATDGKSPDKKYKNFDYEKELREGAARATARNETATDRAKKLRGRKTFSNKIRDEKIKSIGMMTGYNKIEDRIGKDGKLGLKVGQKKAMAPNFDKYQMKIANTMSPYSKLIGMLTAKAGLKGDQTMRSKQRLRTLSMKLNASRDNGPAKVRKQLKGYGDAGSDMIQKYSMAAMKKARLKRKNNDS